MKNEKIVASETAHSQPLKSLRTSAALMLTTLMLVVATSTGAIGQTTFKTLLSFDQADGANPRALVQATNGDLYGNTEAGGTHGDGTVFKITPSGTLTTLASFDLTHGALPNRLVQATDGNLYGTTLEGGVGGYGTVFKITPSGTLTTLASFNGADGFQPDAGLIQATDENLYGTTLAGGTHGLGTVFEITPSGTLTALASFNGADGSEPKAGLVQATDGYLYGTTAGGGASSNCSGGCGTIFKITPSGTLTTVHSFDLTDGANPWADLVPSTDGYLYGTTKGGGTHGYGTVFKITPSGMLTTLHSFDYADGAYPYYTPLVHATDGNLYGTTFEGGANRDGTVFKITPSGMLTTLHSFDNTDGSELYAGLVQDTNGTLYGTTSTGGTHGFGTVFSLSVGLGPFVETVVPSGTGIQATSGKEGTKIGILGQGFSSSSVVKFGGTKATTIVLTGTTFITATVPAGALTGSVTVTTGTTTLTSPQTFDVLPAITSFTPESGPAGTSVTVTGTGLKQTTKVTFDGKSATFTGISDTEVTADVPTGAATGKIAVTTKGGSATSATSFTVN